MDEDQPRAMTPLFDIFVLDRAVEALLRRAMTDSPINALDYAIYSSVADQPGCTATELARRMSVPLTTMADWLGPIVGRGHLDRQRSTKDRRSFAFELTPEGREALDQATAAFGDAYLAFANHNQRSVEELRVVLREMINAARAATEELAVPDGAKEITSRTEPSPATRARPTNPPPRSGKPPRRR